jgi:hypothetical protein
MEKRHSLHIGAQIWAPEPGSPSKETALPHGYVVVAEEADSPGSSPKSSESLIFLESGRSLDLFLLREGQKRFCA